jgi:hypothetical protein
LYDLLTDLKDKYDQAYENRNNYQEKIFTISEAKKLIERVLRQKLNELKTKTMDLYRICSSINLPQELKQLIEKLKIETDSFENLEMKLQSEQIIKSLTKFMRSIEENRRKRPAMQIIDKNSSMDNKSIDVRLLKSVDLVELHKKTTDRALLDSISEELYRRIQGKSTDPLSTPNEIITTNRYFEKYKQKTVPDLSYSYRKLQKQINDILNSNIFRIIDVNRELLIENFIVQTLLDEKEESENTQQDTPVVETALRSLSLSASFPVPVYPPPYPTNTSNRSTNSNSIPIGISHILSAPYPSSNEPSVLPALPSNYSPIQQPKRQQSQPLFRLEDYRYDSSEPNSSKSSVDHQDFMPMPMPMPTDNQQHPIQSNGRKLKSDIILSNTGSAKS